VASRRRQLIDCSAAVVANEQLTNCLNSHAHRMACCPGCVTAQRCMLHLLLHWFRMIRWLGRSW